MAFVGLTVHVKSLVRIADLGVLRSLSPMLQPCATPPKFDWSLG
jgi:hypothetical protein